MMKPSLMATSRIRNGLSLIACWAFVFLFQIQVSFAIDVFVDTASGEVLLRNPFVFSQTLDGYQIDSPSGSLLPSNLGGVSGVLDTSGDMSLDQNSDWIVITSNTNSIVEASLSQMSATLGPGEAVSLGILWDNSFAEDLTAFVSSGTTIFNNPVQFFDLTADYNTNAIIDVPDYIEFTSNYGSTYELGADGNGDGVVNAADYTIWRDAFQALITPTLSVSSPLETTSIQSLAISVPEPSSIFLTIFALIASTGNRRS